ncbi:uncharacterized protein LOC129592660 isoform X2 [Paramacrobiotus metropolitanus]|nr:uncharacterized protein LOC129592660 isoform X2 [Paramacrobiotus metropolitanus]
MEVANIQTAMQQISQDMNNCIRFTPYVDDAHRGHDFIQISKNMFDSSIINPPTPTQTCFSFPGRVTMQYGKGQALYMASGVDGCLHSVREIMRYLVRALGLEDEMNRPDRHYYINVVSDNQLKPHLQNLGLLQRLYSARLLTGSFDYKSITLPSVTQYTAAGHLYAAVHGAAPPSTGNTAFGGLSRLSQGDCLGLRLLYPSTCLIPTVTCPDLYANTSTVTAVITVPMIPGGPIEPPSGSGSYFK